MNEVTTDTLLTDRSIPFYYQIANLLRRRIEEGELGPGDKLPRELDLAKSFGVSRVTLRPALSILEADGLLDRERGNGTFVPKTLNSPEKFKLTAIIEQNLSGEMAHRLISVEDVPPHPLMEEFFHISSEDRLTRIRRLRIEDDIPFCYTINFLPPELAEKITREFIEHRSMLDIIKIQLQIPLGKIRQTFEARIADSEIAGHLSIEILDPVFYIESFVYGLKGEPIKYSQIYYRGNRHKYSIELLSNEDIACPFSACSNDGEPAVQHDDLPGHVG
jgi:GntR family transcriptional regulator